MPPRYSFDHTAVWKKKKNIFTDSSLHRFIPFSSSVKTQQHTSKNKKLDYISQLRASNT